jgi:hypothetical protein
VHAHSRQASNQLADVSGFQRVTVFTRGHAFSAPTVDNYFHASAYILAELRAIAMHYTSTSGCTSGPVCLKQCSSRPTALGTTEASGEHAVCVCGQSLLCCVATEAAMGGDVARQLHGA